MDRNITRVQRKFRLIALAVASFCGLALGVPDSNSQAPATGSPSDTANALRARLSSIRLPQGFSISLFASGIEGARQLAISPGGTLAVGTRGRSVYLIAPGGEVVTLTSSLSVPNGVTFRGQDLYVGEIGRILRYDGIDAALARKPFQAPKPVVVTDKLPTRAHHGQRFLRFGPDGWLYVGIGAPCNVCDPSREDSRFATIIRMQADGSKSEVFARGIRNTVGFDWDPNSRELWFTDNGRDYLGDDSPPDELNRAPKAGLNFGFPFCHGRSISDPEFGAQRPCSEFTRPEFELPAHVAALGMRFYAGTRFPAEYRGNVFIAEHGSWNRTTPIGYRISVINPASPPARDAQGAYRVFAEGWLQGSTPWGRPVDVLTAPDGSLYVSDDLAGAVYRIRYDGPQSSGASAVPAALRSQLKPQLKPQPKRLEPQPVSGR